MHLPHCWNYKIYNWKLAAKMVDELNWCLPWNANASFKLYRRFYLIIWNDCFAYTHTHTLCPIILSLNLLSILMIEFECIVFYVLCYCAVIYQINAFYSAFQLNFFFQKRFTSSVILCFISSSQSDFNGNRFAFIAYI